MPQSNTIIESAVSVAIIIIAASGISFSHRADTSTDLAITRPVTPRRRFPAAQTAKAPAATASNDMFVQTASSLRPGLDESDFQALVGALSTCDIDPWITRLLASIPNPEVASYLLNRLAIEWAKRDPAGTAAWLETLPATVDRTAAVISVHRTWAETDPFAAASHARALATAQQRQSAVGAVLSVWIQQAFPTAAGWLQQCPPAPELDGAAAEIARAPNLIENSPDVAVSWAKRISSTSAREQSLETIFTNWLQSNHRAAAAYLRTSPMLDETERQALIESLRVID